MILIGICGASGSGKSTLARSIQSALSCKTYILGQDCYYKDFLYLSLHERTKINYDSPTVFDYDELYNDIIQLEEKHPIDKKSYDYTAYQRKKITGQIEPPQVLILEGIHAFYDKRICEKMSLKVFMQVDIDVCLLRRIKRDIKHRDRSIDSIATQYLSSVKPMYEQHIARYIYDADFSVTGGGLNQKALHAICSFIDAQLAIE